MRGRPGAALMVCGTASDVGKSQLVTGLCRAFARRGLRVAPFKGQNMALNSVVTAEGCEIGRAQGTQALAAGVEAEAAMNPVLLKPTSDRRSQVVVLGRPWRDLDAVAFHGAKAELEPVVRGALADLRRRFDIVLCEGAGSPAEINLFDHDLVNLGLAAAARVPAVVVGDIDRGGVFAHLYGTVALLPEDRRALVRGFVLNKFRGDASLLGGATESLRRRCGVPTLGVVPYLRDLWIDAEDSLALDGNRWAAGANVLPAAVEVGDGVGGGVVGVALGGAGEGALGGALDVAVVRFPHIANFTDLDPLAAEPGVTVRLVSSPGALGRPDLVVLPGSKATVADLEWLRRTGLAEAVVDRGRTGSVVVGICAGFQMLGRVIEDPAGVEATVACADGLGLLGVRTTFAARKRTARRTGTRLAGGEPVEGYEVHHGRPEADEGAVPWLSLDPAGGGARPSAPARREVPDCGRGGRCDGGGPEGVVDTVTGVYGTSLHGLFESDPFRRAFLAEVADRRGRRLAPSEVSFAAVRQAQVDRLADACEEHLDLDALLAIAAEAG
ncbi:MAG: cobyric acid synthase [Acidimicrobiales bacterium]